MASLIKFEDRYGMFKLFLKYNKTLTKSVGNLLYTEGMGIYFKNNISSPQIFHLTEYEVLRHITYGIDKIILVFDYDSLNGDKSQILKYTDIHSDLQQAKRICNKYNVELECVPVCYSVETIALYARRKGDWVYPETWVNKFNTNKLQLSMLQYLYKLNKKQIKRMDYIDGDILHTELQKSVHTTNEALMQLLTEWRGYSIAETEDIMQEVEEEFTMILNADKHYNFKGVEFTANEDIEIVTYKILEQVN